MTSSDQPALAHLVYFTLKDPTPESCENLIAACRKYLTDHPGTIHFGVGPRAEAYARPINDIQFDIALVLLFANQADHDRYQESQRHQQFLSEQLDHCAQVRVFDALI